MREGTQAGKVNAWILLTYKVAHEPSARRVHVWRKLKRLGALLIDDAVWVLPNLPYTREQFQWLAAEIYEMEGSAMVWEAQLALDGQDEALTSRFLAQTDAVYRALLADLDQSDPDLVVLTKRYHLAVRQDYLHSSLGPVVRDRLASARDQQPTLVHHHQREQLDQQQADTSRPTRAQERGSR